MDLQEVDHRNRIHSSWCGGQSAAQMPRDMVWSLLDGDRAAVSAVDTMLVSSVLPLACVLG